MAHSTSSKSSKSSKPGAAGKGGASGASRESEPPPSSQLRPPVRSGGSYALGAVVLAVAIGVLLYLRCSPDETQPTPAPVATATATATPELPLFAPPPPPEIEEDAGVDAGDADAGKIRPTSSGGTASAGAGACTECGKGIVSSALSTAVTSTAGLARGCYQRALRTSGAEGSITVSVTVGSNGSLCGARITNDSLHNPAISSCVLAKFQGRSYPKPEQGCVVVNVPISFKMKTP